MFCDVFYFVMVNWRFFNIRANNIANVAKSGMTTMARIFRLNLKWPRASTKCHTYILLRNVRPRADCIYVMNHTYIEQLLLVIGVIETRRVHWRSRTCIFQISYWSIQTAITLAIGELKLFDMVKCRRRAVYNIDSLLCTIVSKMNAKREMSHKKAQNHRMVSAIFTLAMIVSLTDDN